jgi:hypothetical protein
MGGDLTLLMSFYIFCWRRAELSLRLQSRNVSVIEGISSQGKTLRVRWGGGVQTSGVPTTEKLRCKVRTCECPTGRFYGHVDHFCDSDSWYLSSEFILSVIYVQYWLLRAYRVLGIQNNGGHF